MTIRTKPILVYTRKHGWIVMRPVPTLDVEEQYGIAGYSRPSSVGIRRRDILAEADLPPPPEEAM